MKTCVVFVLIFSLFSCHNFKKNNSHQQVSNESIAKGEKLAKQYCQSCHQLPDPASLSSKKWAEGVLPQMGPRLGIFAYGDRLYPSSINDKNVGLSYYPSRPVLGFTEWQNIIDYYTSLSPDTLLASKKNTKITLTNQLFSPVQIDTDSFSKPSIVGCVFADTFSATRSLIVSDINLKKMISVDAQTHIIDSIKNESPVVNMVLQNDTLTTVHIGHLNPNDGTTGSVQQSTFRDGHFNNDTITLARGLRRPVHIDLVDLNQDGLKDILVCEYGNVKGCLSWLQNMGKGQYRKHIIREQPGAIATVIKDFNHDGLPDFYVLFAQGNEQIVRFENKGNNRFEPKVLLQFPPSNGSSFFEMTDMNRDGYDDIVYTCGDNADYSIELKPYHGVYLFMNDGNDAFSQQYFFHINGCFKALAQDFDGDGDKDLAAISFFADYKNRPEEGFVYLENKGKNQFVPYSVEAAKNGRWIAMEIADIDKDGKPDIVLGNFAVPSFIASPVDWKKQPPFLLLKNIMR